MCSHRTTSSLTLLVVTIPTRSPPNVRGLLAQTVALLDQVELQSSGRSPLDGRPQATLQTLETIAERLQSPAQHLERALQPWSTYLILPLFALANAGVTVVGAGSRRGAVAGAHTRSKL